MSRIAILTNFSDLNDGYSLTHVVRNQVEMLLRYGHYVTVFVREDFSGTDRQVHIPPYDGCIPPYEEIRYRYRVEITEDHKIFAEYLAGLLTKKLREFDVVFSHDWINLARFLPLAEALRIAAPNTGHLPFFHWIHSIPTYRRDWWDIGRYGPNHKIVYPNKTHTQHVAKFFQGKDSDVVVIPHITDLRTLFDFSRQARAVIDAYPGLMQADFVQVYPAAADRLREKGLVNLIKTFGQLKTRSSVCLLIVDSWTGKLDRENLDRYERLAQDNGLTKEEFGFTSQFDPSGYCRCVPRRVLLELMQCSNLFVYPTKGESFGLGVPETSLAGGTLTVLNESFSPMSEIWGGNGIYAEFGSCETRVNLAQGPCYFPELADKIHSTAMNDESWKLRTFTRQTYSMDAIYSNYYHPILSRQVA